MKRIPALAWAALVSAGLLVTLSWSRIHLLEGDAARVAAGVPEREPVPGPAYGSVSAPPVQRPAGMSATSGSIADLRSQQAVQDAQVKAVVDAGRSRLSAQYEGERVDASWALEKEQLLEQLGASAPIAKVDAAPTSMDARCRTSVCRIDAEFASRQAADDWATLYPLSVGQEMLNLSLRHEWRPDGTVRIELYGLARASSPRR